MSSSDEKARVARLAQTYRDSLAPVKVAMASGVAHVIGGVAAQDDCATIDVSGDVSLVWGSDYVRGSKFALYELGYLDNYDIGYYVVAANISDVAAMGAAPLGVLLVVRYPPDLPDTEYEAILRGARDAARASDCDLLGGDSGGAERIILSASALGVCDRGTAIARNGASPGDVLCITGSIGRAIAALMHFSLSQDGPSRLSAEEEQLLLDSWRRPQPRVHAGRVLASGGFASACQDVSDGLRTTSVELAHASMVRFEIDEARVPLDPAARRVANAWDVDPLALAISASVDFELLFTVPKDRLGACRSAFAEESLDLLEIGRVADGAGVVLVDEGGTTRELPGVDWRHQTEDVATMLSDSLRKSGSGPTTE